MKHITTRVRSRIRINAAAVGVLALGMVFAASGYAKCGISGAPNSMVASSAVNSLLARMQPEGAVRPATSRPTDGPGPSIVGLWNTSFLADGQVVDQGFDLWTSDGMEILNDTSPPATGNVCLGVWMQTGPLTYSLNHPSWIYDDANVNVVAVVFIREKITLDRGGNSFSGTFTIDVFDLSGNSLDHQGGQIKSQRITADEDPTQVLKGGK